MAVVVAAGSLTIHELRLPRDAAPPRDGLAGYHISYEVVTTINDVQRTRREVSVARPFLSRDETFALDGRRQLADVVSQSGHVYVQQGDSLLDLGRTEPGLAGADARILEQLPDLVRAGLAQRRGSDEVSGRPCTIYRLGGPLAEPFTRPLDAEHADVCVDRAGLALREDWVAAGKPIRRTTAVVVDAKAPAAATFTVTDPGTKSLDTKLRPSVVVVLPHRRLPRDDVWYWSADHPPWHARLDTRTRSTSVDPRTGAPSGPPVFVDAYSRRSAAFIVRQTIGELPPRSSGERTVHVRGIGSVIVRLTATGPELRWTRHGVVVRVHSNTDVAHLVAFARHLHEHRVVQAG